MQWDMGVEARLNMRWNNRGMRKYRRREFSRDRGT